MTEQLNSKMHSARKGEYWAARWLNRKGYTIEALNWRKKHFEIDIIASNWQYFIFVEVKLRSDSSFGFPELKINKEKQRQLKNASKEFLNNVKNIKNIRFDVVSVIESEYGIQMRHFEDAFFPLNAANTNRSTWHFLKSR